MTRCLDVYGDIGRERLRLCCRVADLFMPDCPLHALAQMQASFIKITHPACPRGTCMMQHDLMHAAACINGACPRSASIALFMCSSSIV